ncbi:MAG: RNA-binding S4 domain-containing protein [Bacteroidales bacterium]|nr:RNA-binding S4 domain-containing protein [Bacteroidales bacterium]
MIATRIDKYLWSVRLFKTRSQATDACRAGKVSIEGNPLKAAFDVKGGEIIQVKKDHLNLTIQVIEPIEKRVGAKLVELYMKDLTPDEEYRKLELMKQNFEYRDRGLGRPTKKDRRIISKIKRSYEED